MAAREIPKILVMMASYNGEAFIEEQIETILAQHDVEVTLLICDDGSTDGTVAICERIAAANDNVQFRRNTSNLGCARNFMSMLIGADKEAYEYFAFSDQDDHWLPEKLKVAVAHLQGIDGPALYYSNIENTDIDLKNGWMCRNPEYAHYEDKGLALVQTSAGGCVQVFNAALAKLAACDLDEYPRLHDTWIQLVAQFCGVVIPDMKSSYIKRRISGANVEGVGRHDVAGRNRARLAFFGANKHCASRVAQQIIDNYGNILTQEDRGLLWRLAYCSSSLKGKLLVICDGRFHSYRMRGTIFFKLRVLLGIA